MNQIREVAMAYYARSTVEEKQLAQQFFRSLDANGDGRVSLAEYKNLVSPWFSNDQIFKELDENGDGTLDFEEVLALYYMQKAPIPRCDACCDLLLGSYFSCLLCEKDFPQSYDLCCSCYGGGTFLHVHSPANFVDNRSMRFLLAQFMKHAEITQPENGPRSTSRTRSRRETAELAFEAFDTGVAIGNAMVVIGNFAVAAGCRIM